MSNLINKRAVRKLALEIANAQYPCESLPDTQTDTNGRVWTYKRCKESFTNKKYKQVSSKFLEHIETMVRVNMKQYIEKMDGKGSTIK